MVFRQLAKYHVVPWLGGACANSGELESPILLPMPIAPPRVDSSKGPPREIGMSFTFFGFVRPMDKIAPIVAGKLYFPANPDLVDILGDIDLDFENLYS